MGLGNLAHFMHKRPLSLSAGGLKPEQGAEPPYPPHFNHWNSVPIVKTSIIEQIIIIIQCRRNMSKSLQGHLITSATWVTCSYYILYDNEKQIMP